MTNRLILAQPFSSDPVQDAAAVLDAVRAGRAYVVVDGIADGILLSLSSDGFAVASGLPLGAEVREVRNGDRRRLEIDLPNAPGRPPMPWVVTNWTGPAALPPGGDPIVAAAGPLPRASEWRVEKDANSSGQLDANAERLILHYTLAPGERQNQFVAAAADLKGDSALRRITVGGRASSPVRVSVQLRFSPDDHRWVKSVYLDEVEREVTFEVSAMHAADASGRAIPNAAPRSLLLVVDLVNAKPASTGTLTLLEPRVDR